jgi:predicted transcriptional regulator
MYYDFRPWEIKILTALHDAHGPVTWAYIHKNAKLRSPATISLYLQKLTNRGLIAPREPNQVRAVRLTEKGKQVAATLVAAKEAA